MELITHAKGKVHEVFVVRDGLRQAVLVMRGPELAKAETVGCLDSGDETGFLEQARTWVRDHVTGAVRRAGALRRATIAS
jgi:hypothetical protein